MGRGIRASILLAGASLASLAATPANAVAQDTRTVGFSIPAQNLADALLKYAQIADVELIFDASQARAKRSKAIDGQYDRGTALREILRDTGMTFRQGAAGTIIIEPVASTPRTAAVRASSLTSMQGATTAGAAGETPPAEVENGGAIIVTAQRREQRLQDVPVSVSVTTGETLAESNIVALQDLSTRLPNVRIASSPGVLYLNIRGVGSGNNAGFEQAVGTFVDGVYRGRSRAAAAALFDLNRVEILRGPQTTYFGNNVIAGALNITTRKPEFEFGGNVSVLYAPADGEYSAELGLDMPISDSLAVRAAGKLFGMDGYVRNEKLNTDEPRRRDSVYRISVAYEPSSTWRTDFRFDRGNMDDGLAAEAYGCPADDPAYGAPKGTCARFLAAVEDGEADFNYRSRNIGGTFDYNFTELALTNSIDLGFATLSTITAYFEHDTEILSDVAPLGIDGFFGISTTHAVNLNETLEQFSQEVRLTSDTGGFLEYMVGAYYSKEDLDSAQHLGLYQGPFGVLAGAPLPPNAHISPRTLFNQDTESWSVFGSVTLNVTDALAVDLSARYADVKKDIDRSLAYGEGGARVGPDNWTAYTEEQQEAANGFFNGEFGNFPNPEYSGNKLMPSAKVSYKITPDVLAYASYTKGFKAGGFAQSLRFDRFDAETVDAYEAGIKATLANGIFTSLTVFRSDYENLQEATNIAVGDLVTQTIANSAGSRAQGVEFAVNGRIAPSLSLKADVAYLDATYTDFDSAPCTVLQQVEGSPVADECVNGVQDMSGKRRGFAPEWSGSFGLSYRQPVFEAAELRIDPLVYFTSRIFQGATADPLLSQPGYAKVDLRVAIGAEDGGWELALIGKNLTDKKTASFRNQFAGSPGAVWFLPERPRSVALQASLNF